MQVTGSARQRLLRSVQRRLWSTDVLTALVAATLAGMGAFTGVGAAHQVPFGADLGAAAFAGVAIGFSRVAALPSLLLSMGAELGYSIAGWGSPALVFAVGVALYQLALRWDRRTSWILALTCGSLGWVASIYGLHTDWWTPLGLGFLAWTGLPAAFGDAARNRRAYTAEVEARARRAEQNREEEAQRRVAEERLRIARELHDIVAHHIAVINVQSGAAAYALDRKPAAVGPALQLIRLASSSVLKELASIVGLLRQPGDAELANQPQPGVAQVSELLESSLAAGMRVVYSQSGDARPLGAMTDLAGYRITQEALTNARKHGDGEEVSVRFDYSRDRLTIDVTNGVTDRAPSDSPGFGLIGMRERAAAASGTVTAEFLTDGRFRVHAVLPATPQIQEQS